MRLRLTALVVLVLGMACVGTIASARATPWRMKIDLSDEAQRPQATEKGRRMLRTVAPSHARRARAVHRSHAPVTSPRMSAAVAAAAPAADARDQARTEPPRPGAVRATPSRATPSPPSPTALPGPPAVPIAVVPPPTPQPVIQPEPTSLALSVRREIPDVAVLLPFDAGVGAAALMRADQALIVFDAPKPLDLAFLRDDSGFSTATVEVLPAATLLRLRPPPGLAIALTRERNGWRLSLVRGHPPPLAIGTTEVAGSLQMAASRPGRVVAISDPLGGGTLLIGTQVEAGQATEAARQAPEFALLRTIQGVAIEPLSDRLQLERTKEGFRLFGVGGALALAPRSLPDRLLADADGLTRRFKLPSKPIEALAAQLREQLAAAADAPPLGRGVPRIAAARTMIALGMGREALGALRTAASDDPHLADDPGLLGLEGLAAILAGDPESARPLLDPRLAGTDEVALWRALRETMTKPTPSVAAILASTAPLLLTYPTAIQNKLLAPALETMEEQGEAKRAAPILAARPDDPRLAFARAMQAEADGDAPRALAGYDALANGHDRFARVRAALRAVDLRLAGKRITPAEGIAALERLDMAWRGDATELAVRERLAELRLQVGAWQSALALLREGIKLFPDAAPQIRQRMREAVTQLLRDDATRAMPPLDFVSLLQENVDLLGDAAKGPEMQARLANRLLALDLPGALAALTALADRTVPAQGPLDQPARGILLRMAALATRAHDPAAIAALRTRIAGRLDTGPGADTIRLLLAEPVRQLADLSRAGKEAALAGTVAADLRAPPRLPAAPKAALR